jgi:hypothetical protein
VLTEREYAEGKMMLRQAKPFVFDASASAFIGELVRRAAQEVLSQHEWARPPYPVMWMEMDHIAYFKALGIPSRHPDWAPDTQFGVMIRYGAAYIYSTSGFGVAHSSPWRFALHQPMSFEEELEMAQYFGMSRLAFNMALIGTSGAIDDPWWFDGARDLCRSHRFEIHPKIRKDYMDRLTVEQRQQMLVDSTGDLKLVILMLLLLTRPHKYMTIVEQGHKRTLYKGHSLVLQPHSLITMRVEHDDPVKRYLGSMPTGITRCAHDVRGHWAQSRRIGHNCDHSWQPVDINHFTCERCEAKRWWVRDYRTTGKEGHTSEYDVTR